MFIGIMFIFLHGEPVGFQTSNTFDTLEQCMEAVEHDVVVSKMNGLTVIEAGCVAKGTPV